MNKDNSKTFDEKLKIWLANNDVIGDITEAYKEACPEIGEYIQTRVEQFLLLKRSNNAIS